MKIQFNRFTAADEAACLALFDANCPEYFAPNERKDYKAFLDQALNHYETCWLNHQLVGAFGVTAEEAGRCRLNWIMLDPSRQGAGLGRAIMARVKELATTTNAGVIDIAASHKSAGFFAKFGAQAVLTTEDGWGPGMHRVDMELRMGEVVRDEMD